MNQFTFEVIDSQGRRSIDSAEANSREELLLNLESKGKVLLRWIDKKSPQKGFFSWPVKRLKAGERLQLTGEMAHLLKSDLPVDRALTIVADSTSQKAVRETALYLKGALQAGSSLSEAMAARNGDFSDLYVNMIRIGEMGGILPEVMEKLTQFMERTEEIKRFIISSSIYPSILLSIGLISVLVIVGVVVPRFAGIFKDMGQKIPLSTEILMNLSHYLRQWWWLAAALMVIFFILLRQTARSRTGKTYIDRSLVRFPVLGVLLTEIQVSRFARTLGTLLHSGVPLLKALSIVREVVGNHVIKTAVEEIYHQVKEGKRISSLMKDQAVFPAMAVQMVTLGEETGKLGEMLVSVADTLDKKIQSKIKTFLSLLEPIAILLMGLIIGGIVVSMLSAIFGINEIEF